MNITSIEFKKFDCTKTGLSKAQHSNNAKSYYQLQDRKVIPKDCTSFYTGYKTNKHLNSNTKRLQFLLQDTKPKVYIHLVSKFFLNIKQKE